MSDWMCPETRATWEVWDKERANHAPGQAGDESCFYALLAQGVERPSLVKASLAGPFYV